MPLVSICLPNLNSYPFLKARMDSILAQTLTDWELIICDSYSNDGAWQLFQHYKSDPRVRLFQVPREGIYSGWNECLRRAEGKYVYIATSDDTAKPELLDRMVGSLEKHADVDLAVCKFEFIDEAGVAMPSPPFQEVGTFYDPWRAVPHKRSGALEFLVHVGLDCPSWTTITSVVFRRSLLRNTCLFRTDCGTSADRVWAMRTALCGDTLSIPECLATWRQHSRQASRKMATIRSMRSNWQLSAETLLECESQIPGEWKKNIGWSGRILRNVRGQYYKRIGLDRLTLRSCPRQFMEGLAYASLWEPAYFCKRIASGLTWNVSEFGDEEGYLAQLISDWRVPWPPKSV